MPGKMPRRRARRRGFRGSAGRGAGRRAVAVRGGPGAAVHTWSAAWMEGLAGRRVGGDNVTGRSQAEE